MTKGIEIQSKRQFATTIRENEGLVYIVYLRELKENVEKGSWPEKLKTLLREFRDVFPDELPKELLPQRGRLDHRIDFKVRSKELYARNPYRLSQQERKTLKRKIIELIDMGHIRPSISP